MYKKLFDKRHHSEWVRSICVLLLSTTTVGLLAASAVELLIKTLFSFG